MCSWQITSILAASGPVNIFRFIINPAHFGQSVENMYYLSFMFHNGICALEVMENGEPMIYLCERPTSQDCAAGVSRREMIMEFDMATWRRAITVFDIQTPMIPHRAPVMI
ncbi:Non-structural maintenance of chromosome element 4 [Suillus bovinus]|uniref:Non-structural maintenance of chromosome element 4 n=1 Tax=Suillus bovinus TaxID=48563 RepID=UPI001B85E3D9|nr:Non-structural maintenance of chromosome element 4 [Suillus bovinus]KAG2126863.1 Non-structural maintenance of chromosome element 4 [Suillus bovinus]